MDEPIDSALAFRMLHEAVEPELFLEGCTRTSLLDSKINQTSSMVEVAPGQVNSRWHTPTLWQTLADGKFFGHSWTRRWKRQ